MDQVIEKHHFLNNEELYKYNGVYVTGSHIVNEKDEWKTVKTVSMALKQQFAQNMFIV